MERIKKIRWVILVILLLVVTGCNVDYDVTINEDLSVTEKATIKETADFYAAYYRNTKESILKNLLDIHQDNLKEKKYQYEIVGDDNPLVALENNFNNIEEYLNNSLLFNGFFEKINYQKNGDIIKIETGEFIPNDPENPERFNVDKLTIGIKCPYKVINHNAIRVDEKRNIYYYEIDSTTEDFKILLEFDVTKKHNPYIKEIIMIIVLTIISIGMWIFVIINKKKKN